MSGKGMISNHCVGLTCLAEGGPEVSSQIISQIAQLRAPPSLHTNSLAQF